jgi:hypothetical protein
MHLNHLADYQVALAELDAIIGVGDGEAERARP